MTRRGQNCPGGEDSDERMHLGCTKSIRLMGVVPGVSGKGAEAGLCPAGAGLKAAVLGPLSARGFTPFCLPHSILLPHSRVSPVFPF